jgi:transglutaminase-like putative cysteine protease
MTGDPLDARRERAARVTLTVALSVPCALLAAQSGVTAVFGFGAAAALLLLGRRPRPRNLVGLEALAANTVLLGAALGLYAVLVRATGQSTSFGRYLAVAMLALAVPRVGLVAGPGARALTASFGLLALMGLARVVERWPFGAATLIYLVAVLLSVLQADRGFGPVLRHRRGLLGPFAFAVAVTGGLMVLLGWGLPAAEPRVSDYLEPYLGESGRSASGYSDNQIHLGNVREIQTSDEVMMRVTGAVPGLLRGQVYAQYQSGTWYPSTANGNRDRADAEGVIHLAEQHESAPGPEPTRVQVDLVGALGRTIFVPPEALSVSGLPPDTTSDHFGRVRLGPDAEAGAYTVAVGRRFALTTRMPDAAETLPNLRQSGWLGPIARDLRLLEPALPAAEILRRIQAHLAGFTYTLTFDTQAVETAEPVADFLKRSHAGHCELFAAAMVLLARQAGVPARLVTGFRAVEDNLAGGYTVVRGRDAHAWVEAWVEGRWVTYDPTPPGALAEVRGEGAGWLGQQLDVVGRWLGVAFRRLQNLSFGELLGLFAAIVALSALFVVVRRRSARRQRAALDAAPVFEPLAALEAHLATRHQLPRPPGFTLARQAEVLRAAGRPRAAALLDACADLRYGGRGDESALRAAIAAYVRAGEDDAPAQR